MLGLKGKWWKPDGKSPNGTPVDIIVRGFGQASVSNTYEVRPVAIIQELGQGARMRYVELKYVEVQEEVEVHA